MLGVFKDWQHLPRPAFLLLVRMAVSATDSARPPLSYLGQKELAASLGLASPNNGLRRHLQTLIEAGAVTRTKTGGANERGTWRSEFQLHVTPATTESGRHATRAAGEHATRASAQHGSTESGRPGVPSRGSTGVPSQSDSPREEYPRSTRGVPQEVNGTHHHLSPTHGLDWS